MAFLQVGKLAVQIPEQVVGKVGHARQGKQVKDVMYPGVQTRKTANQRTVQGGYLAVGGDFFQVGGSGGGLQLALEALKVSLADLSAQLFHLGQEGVLEPGMPVFDICHGLPLGEGTCQLRQQEIPGPRFKTPGCLQNPGAGSP